MTTCIPEGGPKRYRIELRDSRMVLKTPDLDFAQKVQAANPQLNVWDSWEQEYIEPEDIDG